MSTPRYTGNHNLDTLPIKRGDTVVIPAGTRVKTMHPSRDWFVTKRKQTIKVHHTNSGQSMYLHTMREKDRWYVLQDYPGKFDAEFAAFDQFREEMRSLEGDAYSAAFKQYMAWKIETMNPTVCWPGSGGYWNEVDINDILDANGLAEPEQKAAA